MEKCNELIRYTINKIINKEKLPTYKIDNDKIIIGDSIEIPIEILYVLNETNRYKTTYKNQEHIKLAEREGFIEKETIRIRPSYCGWILLFITKNVYIEYRVNTNQIYIRQASNNRKLLQISGRIIFNLGKIMTDPNKEYNDFDVRGKIREMGERYDDYKYIFDALKRVGMIHYDGRILQWTPFGFIFWHILNNRELGYVRETNTDYKEN